MVPLPYHVCVVDMYVLQYVHKYVLEYGDVFHALPCSTVTVGLASSPGRQPSRRQESLSVRARLGPALPVSGLARGWLGVPKNRCSRAGRR